MPKKQKNDHAICQNPDCGKEYAQKVWWQKFCSDICGGKIRFKKFIEKERSETPGQSLAAIRWAKERAGLTKSRKRKPKEADQ